MVPEVGGSSPLTRPNLCASGGMVDALVLGTSGQPWGFESLLAHQNTSNMDYKNIEKKSYKSSFEVSLDQSAIAKIIDEKISEKQPTFEIAGFRKGKVPVSIIKSKIGLQIENEVLNEEVSKNINKISEDEKIQSLIQPDVNFKDNYNFTLAFYLKPEIKMDELKTSEIEKVTSEVTKKDIDNFVSGSFHAVTLREKAQYRIFQFESAIQDEAAEGYLATKFIAQGGTGLNWAKIVGINAYIADSRYMGQTGVSNELILFANDDGFLYKMDTCLLYTSPSPRD